MTLKEFIDDITKEMKANKWQNMKVEFDTLGNFGMSYLSIYDENGKVIIDVGTDEDNFLRNRQAR